nr:MAG TPA: hypothetical protein [Bacteriophage sp.]
MNVIIRSPRKRSIIKVIHNCRPAIRSKSFSSKSYIRISIPTFMLLF